MKLTAIAGMVLITLIVLSAYITFNSWSYDLRTNGLPRKTIL